jgi:hypothetical protein
MVALVVSQHLGKDSLAALDGEAVEVMAAVAVAVRVLLVEMEHKLLLE